MVFCDIGNFMKKGDLIIGGNEAYRIVEVGDRVKLRLVAGQGLDLRTTIVPKSFLDGKTVYRAISELGDIDGEMAMAEVSAHVDISALGWNPRLWVEAFLDKYKCGDPVPDSTTLLGWFSRLITSGFEQKTAEIEAEAKLKLAKQRKAKSSKAKSGRANGRHPPSKGKRKPLQLTHN
jgi:hypothetical protein